MSQSDLGKWTKEESWEWYRKQPWIRGFNGLPSNCVNGVDMWQRYNHDKVAKQFEFEFALAEKTGLNAVRVGVATPIWKDQHDDYMRFFEDYLRMADNHGIKVMILLGGDCSVPKRFNGPIQYGEQHVDWGWHSGIELGPHRGGYDEPGWLPTDEEEGRKDFYGLVEEFASLYAHDERVQLWNIWNEIGNSKRQSMSVPVMEKAIEILRSYHPIQPLTVEAWSFDSNLEVQNESEKRAMELSDVISFHSYLPYPDVVRIIEKLKKYDRPILCTEWLNRISHNNVEEIFPLFYLEQIGSYHWGLMQGYSQTFEPWGCYLDQIKDPDYHGDLDLLKWQHDLYRFNGLPYIASEIAMIQKFAKLADERYKNEQHKKE